VSSYSNEGEDDKKGQPPLPQVPPRWGGMPPNLNPYFPWYPTMPPMTITTINSDGAKKFLNYLEYTKNSNLDVHV
jgi:hypothetical protein